MKKFVFCMLFCCSWAVSVAQLQQKAENVVADFGYNLNQWCRTNDPSYRQKLVEMCVPDGFRVSDQIAVEKAQYQGKYQDLNAYLKIFGDIRSENTQITFSNIRRVKLNNCKTQEDALLQPVYVEIDVKSPLWNYLVSDVFYVKNNKIVYIGDNDGEICQDCACEEPYEIVDLQLLQENIKGDSSSYISSNLLAYENECQWIRARVEIKSKKMYKGGKIYTTIKWPNGKYMIQNHVNSIDINEGDAFYYISSWGYENGTYTVPGKYEYTVYSSTSSVTRYFEILPQESKTTDELDITNVMFVGLDKKGNEITNPVSEDGVLESGKKIKGVKVKFTYAKLNKDISVNLIFDLVGRWIYYDNSTNRGVFVFQKNSTQDEVSIMFNKIQQNDKIRIELAAGKEKKYNYIVKIGN